jgi:hypothetical protein
MRIPILTTLSLSLLVTGGAALLADPAAGNAGDPQARLFSALSLIMLGPRPDPHLPKSSLIMAVPGFPIPDAGLDTRNPSDCVFLNQTLDMIPTRSPYYLASGRRYSDVYNRILNESAVQQPALSPEDQKDLADAKAVLDPRGAKAIAYRSCQDAYNAAVDARNASLGNGNGATEAQTDAVTRTWNNWRDAGFYNESNLAQVAFNRIVNKGAASWWSELLDTMNVRNTDTATPMVVTFPAPEKWGATSRTWAHFHWAANTGSTLTGSSDPNLPAAAAYSAGGLDLPAQGAWNKQAASVVASDSSTVIDVELLRVAVYRPWLDTNVFSSTAWDYQGKMIRKGQFFSDGNPLATNTGIMPVLINQIWLARNLTVTGKWVPTYADAMTTAAKAHLKVSYGPFNLSGGHRQPVAISHPEAGSQEDCIVAKGVQVIAFIGSTVPRCPSFVPEPTATAAARLPRK